MTKNSAKIIPETAQSELVMVDGLGIGDVGNIVLRDRKMLSESGLLIVLTALDKKSNKIVSGPDIISRGFVYVRDNENLISDTANEARRVIENYVKKNKNDFDMNALKLSIRHEMKKYIYQKTKRNPLILPIFMGV